MTFILNNPKSFNAVVFKEWMCRGQRLGEDDHCERETTRLGCYQEVQEAKNHPSTADPNEPSNQGAREVNAQNLEETRTMSTMLPLRHSY